MSLRRVERAARCRRREGDASIGEGDGGGDGKSNERRREDVAENVDVGEQAGRRDVTHVSHNLVAALRRTLRVLTPKGLAKMRHQVGFRYAANNSRWYT